MQFAQHIPVSCKYFTFIGKYPSPRQKKSEPPTLHFGVGIYRFIWGTSKKYAGRVEGKSGKYSGLRRMQ
jgi:hypothetical protein